MPDHGEMESSGVAENGQSLASKRHSKDSSKRRSKSEKSSRDGERSKEEGKESSRRSIAQQAEEDEYDIVPTVKDFGGMRKVSRLGFEDPVDLAMRVADTKPSRGGSSSDLTSPRRKARPRASSSFEESEKEESRPSSADIKKSLVNPRRLRSNDVDFSPPSMLNIKEGDEEMTPAKPRSRNNRSRSLDDDGLLVDFPILLGIENMVDAPTALKPMVTPPAPTPSPQQTGPSFKMISPTLEQLKLMRQVSGLGLEDPIFGASHKSTRPCHPSDLFEDMDLADVPEGMRDVLSIFSDHTDPVFVFDKHALKSPLSTSSRTKETAESIKPPSSQSMRCAASPKPSQKNVGFTPPMGSFAQKSLNRNGCPSSPVTHPNPPLPSYSHSSINKIPKLPFTPLTPTGTKKSLGSKSSKSSADSPQHLLRSFVPPSGSFFGRFHKDHTANDNTRDKNAMLNDIARAAKEESRSPTEKNKLDMDDLAVKYHNHLANDKESSADKSRGHSTSESPTSFTRKKLLINVHDPPTHSRQAICLSGRGEVYVPPPAPNMNGKVPELTREEHRTLPSMTEALAASFQAQSSGIISWAGDLAEPGMSHRSLRAEPSLGKPPRLNDSGKEGSLKQQHSSKRKEKKASPSRRRRAGSEGSGRAINAAGALHT
jgi:hypothetical protein